MCGQTAFCPFFAVCPHTEEPPNRSYVLEFVHTRKPDEMLIQISIVRKVKIRFGFYYLRIAYYSFEFWRIAKISRKV